MPRTKEQAKEYRATHKEEIKRHSKKFRDTHKEEVKAYNKKYNQTHNEERKKKYQDDKECKKRLLDAYLDVIPDEYKEEVDDGS